MYIPNNTASEHKFLIKIFCLFVQEFNSAKPVAKAFSNRVVTSVMCVHT